MTAWLQGLFATGGTPFFDFFSTWGGPSGWLLVGFSVFWLSGSRNGLRVGFALCIAGVTNTWLKWLIAAPRPFYIDSEMTALRASDGFGMPSGHAQGVVAVWGDWLTWSASGG